MGAMVLFCVLRKRGYLDTLHECCVSVLFIHKLQALKSCAVVVSSQSSNIVENPGRSFFVARLDSLCVECFVVALEIASASLIDRLIFFEH